jgi:hypothetical protein
MAENKSNSGVSNRDFQDVMSRRHSRRDILQKASRIGTGAAVAGTSLYGYGSLLSDLLNRTNPIEEVQDTLGVYRGPEHYPFSEDTKIREIEERLNIRLVSQFQAYELLGVEFNEFDSVELAQMQPIRWDSDRAKLVEDSFKHLPDFFHEPERSGAPLLITLVNSGERSPGFSADYNSRGNLVRLDVDNFTTERPKDALHTITHESIHRLQDMGYSRIKDEVRRVFNKDFEVFAKDTLTWLENVPEGRTEEQKAFLGLLRYGVQDKSDTPENVIPRKEHLEFEAVLGQFYIQGFDVFMSFYGQVYGDKAEDLYRYMRDRVFGGQEYDRFPLGTEKKVPEEELDKQDEINKRVEIFNSVIEHLIDPQRRVKADIPLLDSNDSSLVQLMDHGSFELQTGDDYSDGELVGSHAKVVFREQTNPQTMTVEQRKDESGNIVEEILSFMVNDDGRRIRGFPTYPPHPQSLKNIANSFLINPDGKEVSWNSAEFINGVMGDYADKDTYYSIYIDFAGAVRYRRYTKH